MDSLALSPIHSSSTPHYRNLLGWEIWNCHYSTVCDLQIQSSHIVPPDKLKKTSEAFPIILGQNWVLLSVLEVVPCLPAHIHLLLGCIPYPFRCSSHRAHSQGPCFWKGFPLPVLCCEVYPSISFLCSSAAFWACSKGKVLITLCLSHFYMTVFAVSNPQR